MTSQAGGSGGPPVLLPLSPPPAPTITTTTAAAAASSSNAPSAHATDLTPGQRSHSQNQDQQQKQSRLAAAPLRSATHLRTSNGRGPATTESTSMVEDIEMESMTGNGHRRRRSSAANGGVSSGSGSGSGAPNGNGRWPQGGSPSGEPKISEEDDDSFAAASLARRDHSHEILSDEDLHDDEETGLTNKERRRKRDTRRRHALLDQRIARDGITAEERKEADQTVIRKLAVNGSLILLWYLFSLSISLYNKWMFDEERLGFKFPLFTTSFHMIIQFGLASLVLYFVPSLRPQNAHKSDLGRSRHENEPDKPVMTKMFYLTRIAPCGAATGLDIGLGNTSLQFITLTFYTMCKSSSLAFVLIFAFLFRLETPTWRLVAIIATMTLGVIMMVAGEVVFKLGGFVLVISAAFFSGFRWALTQILLLRNPATSNPFASIFFLAPVMFLVLVALAIPVEGVFELMAGIRALLAEWGPLLTPMVLLFPGCIAFLMTASEFALLQRTSVVTLSIAGIFKEVVTILAAALVFEDRLTPVNFVGLLVTLVAIVAYNFIKITKMREQAQLDVRRGHDPSDDGGSGGSSSRGGSDAENDEDGGEETGLLRGDGHNVDAVAADGRNLSGHPVSTANPGATRSQVA